MSLVEVDKTVIAEPRNNYLPMLQAAVDKGADIGVIERLVAIQEKFERKEEERAFLAALSAFQSEIPVIAKRGKASFGHRDGGGKTEYSFALLSDISEAVKPLLARHGLSYRFSQDRNNLDIIVTCVVSHIMGHSERVTMSAAPDSSGKKNQIQQAGSTVSYLQRYTLCSALGITTADDDNDGHSEAPPYMDDAQFNGNLPGWMAALAKGKTVDEIIARVNKSGLWLTDEQINKLKQPTEE